jgi:hypothetical protein
MFRSFCEGDYLSVSDFHKTEAYARLYSVQNPVETTDMSISFVTATHPRKLFAYLREVYGYSIHERWPGIYYVTGDIFAVQIIESKRLEGDGAFWLKELRRGLNGERIREIIEVSGKMPKGAPLSAYLHTVLQANSHGLKEMMKMSYASFEAVLEEYGLTAKWEARGLERGLEEGLERGLEEGREEAVKRLQKYGMEPRQIAEALELPLDIQRYRRFKYPL